MSAGMIAESLKFFAQIPMMKPNRLNVTEVRVRKPTIQTGCSMRTGTNRVAVARMTSPMPTDLVAAAPT